MSKLNISPDLFLETIELERFRKSTDEEGFRRNIIDNTVRFGFIKNINDVTFSNGKVEADADANGTKNVKIRATKGIDSNGQFFTLPVTTGISIPSDSNWYWIKINHSYSNIEKGVFTLSANGDLIDTSGLAKLTKIFRGMPNFPTRISFVNSTYNTLDFDVLQVLDDSHAVIQHPATNGSGIAAFQAETNLSVKIVGTFTPSISIPTSSRYCFNYDAATLTLISEVSVNVSPVISVANTDIFGNASTTSGFDIARVKSDGTNLIIQDKRGQVWETKGSNLVKEITKNDNVAIGIESVKWNDKFTAGDRNIVEIAWGMRSNNWSVDTAHNIVTFNIGQGGRYKTVNDFTNGDMDGFRLYSPNGNFSKVISSAKQGNAINFTIDSLDINNFSTDGGSTFISGYLNCIPDCEQVEIQFTPNIADQHDYLTERFVFPANTLIGKCNVIVYADDTVLYNVQYRYKSVKEFSQWKPLPSDTVGYYTEASFTATGVLKAPSGIVNFPVVTDPVNGFIQLKLSPLSISRFKNKVDKGDLIGVNQITTLVGITSQTLVVGYDKNYQYLSGDISLPNDVYFNIDTVGSIDGNEFRFHIDCSSLALNNKNIYITQGFGTSGQRNLKVITQGDVYAMLNSSGGLMFDCKFKVVASVGNWVISQNYLGGKPFEITMFDNDITQFFDTNLNGNVKGYFGWQIYSLMSGRMPIGYGSVSDINGNVQSFPLGNTGGELTHKLTVAEMPSHTHPTSTKTGLAVQDGHTTPCWTGEVAATTGATGGDQYHNNLQPYRVVAFIKRLY